MNISFYTASVGAQQQQERLNVHGNNLANVNNYGFKAKKPSFSQLMTGPVQGIEEDLPRGVGARMIEADTDFAQSGLADTGRELDYGIEGDGFFALMDPTSGEISYTRDGSFVLSSYQDMEDVDVLDENGEPTGETQRQPVTHWYLSDGLGRFVMSTIGERIRVDGQEALEQGLDVGVFDFINYDGMQSMGDNRFIPVDKNGDLRRGSGKVVQGVLEQSNTDLAYEFAKVIESQRSFSFMLRMVTASDEIESTVNSLRQ